MQQQRAPAAGSPACRRMHASRRRYHRAAFCCTARQASSWPARIAATSASCSKVLSSRQLRCAPGQRVSSRAACSRHPSAAHPSHDSIRAQSHHMGRRQRPAQAHRDRGRGRGRDRDRGHDHGRHGHLQDTGKRERREEGWLRARRGVGSGHACGQQQCGCFVCMRRLQAGVADTADTRVSFALHRQRGHRSTAGDCAH